MTNDIIVNVEQKLPRGMAEAVMPFSTGYMIYIDRNLSHDQRQKALQHALHHIRNNDFEGGSVQEIEARAHQCG